MLALNAATIPEDLAPFAMGFHPLKGDRKGEFALTIRGNWRIVFEWEDGDAVRVRQEDYHGN
jgi:toxin HigB-1